MSQSTFEQFRQLVLQKPDLQEKLREITDYEKFVAQVVAVGTKNGFAFTAEDVAEAMRENRLVWIERWI